MNSSDALVSSPFLQALAGQKPSRTPVWFMRQAGRSLPEYLKVREGIGMLESCQNADLITEITLQPVRRYGVDAAIFFSDIVLPLKAVGVDLDIKPGVGPVVADPVRTLADVEAIPDLAPEHVTYITEAVHNLVGELAGINGGTPLIGFAGAPFTVASYLVEGGPSKDYAKTKALMFGAPDVWDALMRKIAGISAAFLEVQVRAGASAVQLFDSWAGACNPADYERFVLPYSAGVLSRIGELGVPRIHFGVNSSMLLPQMGRAGAEAVGVDWRTPLDWAIGQLGDDFVVQGNLDPALVFAPTEVMLDQAASIIETGRQAKSHIFNLGHGVIPSTDPDQLARLTEFVQSR
ncbi:uroporphyrinogen decarboxylase [Nocardioides albertanoniae]|uniref:Uroporphyrinogen decarboxylase n=1 Tax=Nocardioides albertanoniae TaxID=1175486 RepID=A0A543A3M0_9ACTN|nr:uroporphyrinogen decarboxylase [Nocardioides albertanoniae]TQL67177.1 uroporphyrinogen decarboxylase [Nocardioides albertanoniae]